MRAVRAVTIDLGRDGRSILNVHGIDRDETGIGEKELTPDRREEVDDRLHQIGLDTGLAAATSSGSVGARAMMRRVGGRV